jgi:pimeloyl-ACP methyl ester carboxylesterase
MAAGCCASAIGSPSRCSLNGSRGAGPWPGRFLELALHSGHYRARLGRRIQRDPHEHAQLRRHGSLTPTLYHSGLSGDVGAVVRHFARQHSLERVALVGYSMGGNLVLKLAGEWGSQPPLSAVAAVCPAIDLAAGADALHEPLNRAYEWKFLRGPEGALCPQAGAVPGQVCVCHRDWAGALHSAVRSQNRLPLLRLSRRGRLLLPRRQRPRGRPNRPADVHPARPGRPFHPPASGNPRQNPCQRLTSPLSRRAMEATAPIFPAIRATRFTGLRRP